MKLRSIIVDDEPIARSGLAEDLKDIEYIEIVGMAENAIKAMELISSKKPDLIFLDIEMPRINGLDLLKSIKQPPVVIIVSAYSKYAINGYELDVTDYLIKPVDFNRLLKACTKAMEYIELRNATPKKNTDSAHYFFVKCDGKLEKVFSDDLHIVEGANNYVILHTTDKRLLVYDTMKNILEQLPKETFFRVHKSFIVSVDKVTGIEGHEILVGNRRIKMSRGMKAKLVETLLKK